MTGGHPEAGPALSPPSGQEPQPERGLWRIISFWAGHFVFGCGFILLIIGILLAYTGGGPASIQQVNVLRVVTAVGAACITSEVPGLLKLRIARWLTAAGARAVFAAVFFWWR